jgi:hypothetical protein
MSVFEAGMMICFGVSWPVAVYKTFKAKSVKGKSMTFSCLIMVGYICGVIHKIFFYYDWVLWLYLLNMLFVFTDMCLHLKYKYKPIKQKEDIC